ncbi:MULTISPECIES: daptide-type RiPP [unclassified Streptomyces]|uniref:daptide-type RiPP n=1 Tax=unclassified Streptomyces TaxID=2593676 RepID=UPI000A440983|nr:daptide-type RiPP [Streptomyces sp. NBC_00370]
MENNSLELAMQELDMEELEGMEAPDWWSSFLASFAVSAGVSAAYSTIAVTSVIAT